jgi:hypothetical protein
VSCNERCWCVLWPFGICRFRPDSIFYGHLVIWYSFSILVYILSTKIWQPCCEAKGYFPFQCFFRNSSQKLSDEIKLSDKRHKTALTACWQLSSSGMPDFRSKKNQNGWEIIPKDLKITKCQKYTNWL